MLMYVAHLHLPLTPSQCRRLVAMCCRMSMVHTSWLISRNCTASLPPRHCFIAGFQADSPVLLPWEILDTWRKATVQRTRDLPTVLIDD